jgi:pimeloyl-ACP methyl ester carboxylesterase
MLRREAVEIDLVPVPYHVEGEGEPVIMIHLPTSPHHCFSRNVSEIAKHFKVYVVDLRPAVVLKTWRMRKIPLLDFLEGIVLKFMDRLGIERVRLVGGHKAGAIAMYLAARHPERVHKLVLYSTLGLTRSPSRAPAFRVIFFFMRWPGVPLMGRVRWLRRLVKWMDVRGAGQWRVGQFFGPNEPHDKYNLTRHLVEIYTTFLKPPDVWAYEVMIFTIRYLRYAPVVPLIPKIPHKTLLVFGDDEYAVPKKTIEEYGRLIKNSEIITVENTRLYPHYEQAEKINQKTVEFLIDD